MNTQTLVGLWKANVPPGIWMYIPFWIGAIILALDGGTPEWGTLTLFMVAMLVLTSIAEFANKYADKDEDWLYWPSNPLTTGELEVGAARKAFIIQNALAGALLVALLLVTLNYALIAAMVVGWLAALTYSVPPFRFKETLVGPIVVALGDALLPLVAWLVVAPANSYIIGFSIFCFVFAAGVGITVKLRKTYHALHHGLIHVEPGENANDVATVGFRLSFKTATILEIVLTLGAFALIPVFWYAGILDTPISIALLSLPLGLTILAVILRVREPIENSPKCALLFGASWIFIIISLFVVGLAEVLPWSLILLACIVYAIGGPLLFRTIHPVQLRALKAPWQEM
jgi:4-hydroxybenzoate polyprenyltransferase